MTLLRQWKNRFPNKRKLLVIFNLKFTLNCIAYQDVISVFMFVYPLSDLRTVPLFICYCVVNLST